MPYIGRSLGDGVRARYIYAATSGQTSFSGNDANGIALAYSDTLYMDVYQNGVLLKPISDYASTTGTSVVLVTGASTDDVVEMIVYDSFAVADTVSAANGGSFGGAVSVAGAFTSPGIDDNADATAITIDSSERVGIGVTSMVNKLVLPNASYFAMQDSGGSESLAIRANSSNTMEILTGGGVKVNIDSSGRVTMPSQPSFLATGSWSYDTNKFWKGFSTIGHNVGSHWNNTTGTWTCPIAGSYLIYANVHHSTISTYHLWCFSKNGNVINSWIQTYNGSSAGENTTASSLITVCAANDTLRFYSNGSYANGYTTGYATVGVHLIG